ncbi:hypothetical protein PV326_000266 [Microctonus aethiopoides]|nr:hypothetical protein PV326_000266 [Microctonus aethiopoides]
MFSLVLNTAKYFLGNSKDVESDINDAFEKLKVTCDEHENFVDDDEVCEDQNNEGCFYQDGIITSITGNSVLIDDRYICDSENVACHNLNVGTKVHYMAYQKDENSDPKIQKIISIVDGDDDYSKNCTANNQMFKKSIVVKVMKREGRIFHCEPSNIKFNLDKINSTFVPYVGDWLTLKSLVELNEESGDLSGEILEIDEIQPLRSKIKIGFITKYDQKTGVGAVDKDTIFVKSSCKPGYIPCIGDKVVCDSIESDQGIYTWRCLTVVPLYQVVNNNKETAPPADATTVPKTITNKHMEALLLDKNGITITDNLFFEINVNETKELPVVIKNCGDITHTIKKCVFTTKKDMSQLSLISPSFFTVTSLKPAETITYLFKCTAKFVGTTEELVIFCFNNFIIGRNIKITVHVKKLSTSTDDADTNAYYRNNKNKLARQDIYDQESYIPGIRPSKPPSFIAVRSGVFNIPQRLWNIILPCVNQRMSQTEMETIVGGALSHLHDILNPNNYRDRFHTLLYLEEISLIIDMQKYDMDSTIMTPSGEYLVLKVPGLAEKRPSLIVGDRAIVTFKWDTSSGNIKHEGCIHKIKSSEVYLKFNPNFHNTYSSEDCQVTFKCSFSSIARCHNAVNLAVSALGPKILFPTSVVENEPQINLEELSQCNSTDNGCESLSSKSSLSGSTSSTNSPGKYAKLANLLPRIDTQKGNVINTSIDPHISQIKKRKLIWFNKKLNHYQKEAVRNILCGVARPLPYIIFGPPGTGKTITLCEAILQILTTIPESRLLIATPSNSSANLIAERLLDSGVLKPGDLVRLIAHHCFTDDSIPEKLLPYCATGNLAAENSSRNSYRSNEGVRMNCTMRVLGRHRITVGTCAALGLLYNMGFPRGHFSHIIVDEAGQATEPEIMIPLSFTHSSCGQIILAGDPMQLGPVVNSQLAKYFGLGESFLIRLLQQFPYQRDTESYEMGYDPRLVTKLIINYRSLPEILELPNTLFYDLELKANLSATTSPEAELLRSIASILPTRDGEPPAIVFHGINGKNCQDSDSPSWYNPAEATQVYLYLMRLYNHGITENDVGIIAPYKKQVSQIRALLTELDMQLPKIGSVEEFQGQERKIIILSTVRSTNKHVSDDIKYSLGFIASPRRLNVAITRARSLIIILGDPNLLSQDPYWRNVLNYCIKNESYTGCNFSLANIEANCDELNQIYELSK